MDVLTTPAPSGSKDTPPPLIGPWRFFRAIILSLLFAPWVCYWAQADSIDRIFSLMVPPVVATLVVVAINAPLRRYARRWAFSEGELVIFYAMQAVLCAMASEWLDNIDPYIYSYGLFQNQNPDYASRILPYISSWLFFKSPKQLEDFRVGGHDFAYFLTKLPIWWPKILAWTLIVTLVALAMLCVNSLMRDQWTNREKLSFPIIQLPIAITEGGGASPFWRNRYMLGGFGVMFAIDMLNGFAFLYPSLPQINVRFLGDLQTFFPSPPWNQIGWTPIGIFPFISAIGLFMPTDLLFSCVFFFFLRKGEQVIAASLGNEQGVFGGGGLVPSPPYFSEQSWGAFIGLFIGAVWVSRGYLREVWREVVKGGGESRAVSHRFALAGLVGSMVALGGIGIAVGLPFTFVLAYAGVFLLFSTALTRLRAQLGPPTHEMAFMGPTQLMVDSGVAGTLSNAQITRTVTLFHFMNRIHRTHPMPDQLEAMKMGGRSHVDQRAMFGAILLATIAGSVLGHLARIYLGYRYTPGDSGGETTGVVTALTDTRQHMNPGAMLAVVAGLLVVLCLDFIRYRVPGFPFHPAGYALCMNFGVDYYWFGLLLVLILKVLVQRYYGLKGYERLRMIALGVILGEFVAEAIWATAFMVTRHAMYSISINGMLGWNR